jgi:SAM-dependent methyltransferase
VADTREPRYRRLLAAARAEWPSDRLFDHYQRHYLSEIDRGRFILRTLSRYIPDFRVRGRRVLDIGCGDAGVAIAFALAGATAVGLEPGASNLSRGRVRAADHRVRVPLLRGVAEDLPFPAASQDLVVLDNVLEHVSDQERTLAEIRRVLAPDGLLYLVTPKPYAIHSLMSDPHYGMTGLVLLPRSWQKRLVDGRLGPGAYDVGRIPTRRGVARALGRHGFETLIPPRELWARYVCDRVSRPEEVRPGLKRRIARVLAHRPGWSDNGAVRFLLDIALGSNYFVARRRA